MQVQPYLIFGGRCEEAIEFYRGAVGAQVKALMRFKDAPEQPPPGALPPGSENRVMHSELQIGSSVVMATDGGAEDAGGVFKGFALALAPADEAEARKAFDALAAGGTVVMPLSRTFWSPCFGMLTDRFGVRWMINVA